MHLYLDLTLVTAPRGQRGVSAVRGGDDPVRAAAGEEPAADVRRGADGRRARQLQARARGRGTPAPLSLPGDN